MGSIKNLAEEKTRSVFARDEIVILRPVTIDDADFYVSIKMQHSLMYRHLIQIEKYRSDRLLTEDLCQPESFFCIVEEVTKSAPIGYIGIKDTRADIWEIAIELDGQHIHSGFGRRSIRLFLNEMYRVTGKVEYKATVEADNLPSQKCLEKLGADLTGLCNGSILTTNEEKEKFESRNLHLIDDNIRTLAMRLRVDPRKLLSHLLEYRITCPL